MNLFQMAASNVHISEKLGETGTPGLHLCQYIPHPRVLKNNIDYSTKQGTPPFFHTDGNLALGHVLVYSIDKTHVLVITLLSIWLLFLNILPFNFVLTPNKSLRFT